MVVIVRFHCTILHRYWGEDEEKPKRTLSLEALHQLAKDRAHQRSLSPRKRLLQEDSQEGAKCTELAEPVKKSRAPKNKLKKAKLEKGTCGDDLDKDEKQELGHRIQEEATCPSGEVIDEDCEKEVINGERPSTDDELDPNEGKPTVSENGVNEEATPTLTPLGHAKPKGSSVKKTVHRQLPDWIQTPHIVENSIQSFSQ